MGTGRRKQRIGTVVSDKMQKSIVVAVRWSIMHPLYKKPIRRVTKFMAHDEENTAKIGDTVRIEETRPLSADKRWRLIEVVKRGEYVELPSEETVEEAAEGAR